MGTGIFRAVVLKVLCSHLWTQLKIDNKFARIMVR